MPRNQLAWLFIGAGLLLGIPATIVLALFLAGLSDVGALTTAPVCATPTQDGSSNCLSEFAGTITAVTLHSKSLDHVTLAVGGVSYDLGYDCPGSSSGACAAVSFQPGTPIVAGWWRGQLVAFGAAESRPTVATELNPSVQLRLKTVLLPFTVVPSLAFIVGGLFLRQAPMTIDDLVKTALAKWPDPPRAVDQRLLRRVALGYWAPYGLAVWFIVSLFESIGVVAFSAYGWILPVFVATFALSLVASAQIAARYLTHVVVNTARMSITVRHIESGVGKSGKDTQASYYLLNGTTATTILDLNWNGRIKVGDALDALTDPKIGSIVRLLSEPPAQE